MKLGTDFEQSRKLAMFLPIDSADMYYNCRMDIETWKWHYDLTIIDEYNKIDIIDDIPAWSLSALFGVLPIMGEGKDTANPFIAKTPAGEYYVVYATLYKEIDSSGIYSNPVDPCVEMIIKLHERELL